MGTLAILLLELVNILIGCFIGIILTGSLIYIVLFFINTLRKIFQK